MYHGERFNGISHLIGAVAAAVGLTILVVLASLQGDPWKIVSFSIYGATLLLLYTFSTLYHSVRGQAKTVLRKIDHNAIYLLIAGTYTPFTLVTLRGPWGWSIFGVIWGLAVLGIVIDTIPRKGPRVIPIIIYLVMGWLALIALKPLIAALPPAGVAWLVIGGMLYTGGLVFFALDGRLRHAHGLWHLFVLAGSTSHFIVMLRYVL